MKVVVDVKKAERAGCRFRKTGNLVWLTSQTIPPEAIVKFEEWDDLADKEAASSSHSVSGGGLWEPKQEVWTNQEDPELPVPVTQDVAEVAHALAEAAVECPEGASMKVDPSTFAVEVCEQGEEEDASSSDEEKCDWDPGTEEEVEVVQAIPAKTELEMDGDAKMEIVEEEAPPKKRKKLQLGSAQILLLQAVGDADASNWASLQQCIQAHNTTGAVKSDFLRRLEQLADLRQESRQGAIMALQSERDRAWRVS